MSDELRYPVGKWVRENNLDPAKRTLLIDQIARAPGLLSAAVAGLTEAQLDTPYRPAGWTVRQVVHHVADSHLNAYVRCKLAVTEEHPTVKPYDEGAWSNLGDVATTPVVTSLTLLSSLHSRWVLFLRSLDAAAFARTTHHPEQGSMSLDEYLTMYAWHGRHHTAHITVLATRMEW